MFKNARFALMISSVVVGLGIVLWMIYGQIFLDGDGFKGQDSARDSVLLAQAGTGVNVVSTSPSGAVSSAVETFSPSRNPLAPPVDPKKAEVTGDPPGVNFRKVVPGHDHINGDFSARVTIIEYSDYICPYCGKVNLILKDLVQKYDGQVNWVYRHFPLSSHEPAASNMAEAAECANEIGGNGKFWEFGDALYEGFGGRGDDFTLVQMAVELGFDKKIFQDCLEADKFQDRITADREDGENAGIDGTPAMVIFDNETGKAVLIVGAQSVRNFEKVIDAMLAE